MSQTNTRLRTILTLYSSADEVQSHRVRMVLAAKGVGYDRIVVDPSRLPGDLTELNPHGTLPTLVDRDLVLYDTAVICEYIDERYPHPPLMPVDPLSRARLRLAMIRIEQEWLPLITVIRTGGRPAETARKHLHAALVAALPLFKASRFFLGSEVSLADCLVAPIIWRLPNLGIDLPREAKAIIDYGERIFRSQGFGRSVTLEEKALRE
ncbi:MAG TPA: glutathione S-transferase N-terminal domain-containing protein [Rhodanobacteraceae bacterium]|nr:glutathione S-transferase N-terminal domain-containing protein [Rhodanobacteraceae bacterium]